VIPAAIIEAEAHALKEGVNAGKPLSDLPDDVLVRVVKHYKKELNFHEWRAAYITACARVLREHALLEAPRHVIERAAQGHGDKPLAARWYLEWFGKELG